MSRFTEFQLIRRFTKAPSRNDPHQIVPSGDDAFVGFFGGARLTMTVDVLTENADFRRTWYPSRYGRGALARLLPGTDFSQLGVKLARVNLSDLYAMGDVRPRWAVGTMSLNERYSHEEVLAISRGVRHELERHGCAIVGGDISRSVELELSLTLIGEMVSGEPKRRDGYAVGDVVCVTGFPGDARAGYHLIERTEHGRPVRLKPADTRYLVRRHLLPDLRHRVMRPLLPHVTAMMDVSDGLARSLDEMVRRRTDVSLEIDAGRIPVSGPLRRFCAASGEDPRAVALSGGEDFEVLFTARPDAAVHLQRTGGISVIGTVIPRRGGRKVILHNYRGPVDAFDHFSS